MADCARHHLPSRPSTDPRQPYYVLRCMHIGSRFVVDVRSRDSAYVACDYVEDLPGGELLVEPGDQADYWEEFTARLLSGDPPHPWEGGEQR